jgi:hypothetical protein
MTGWTGALFDESDVVGDDTGARTGVEFVGCG